MDYIVDFIFYTSLTTTIIGGIYGFSLLKNKAINYLVLLQWASAIADIIGAFSSHYYIYYQIDLGIRGVSAAYQIIEFLILVFFFCCLKFNKNLKSLLKVASLVFVIYFISIQPAFFRIFVDTTILQLTSAILVITFSMLFYKSIITKMEVPNITHWPPLYLISALFIYFSGACFSMLVSNSIYRIDIDMGNYIWIFHNASLIIRNILLIIGFYYAYKTKYKWEPISLT
uniref:hypothetical protein n=1 Tax=Fulvivirga sp. TaxID=1931237 RepID=UPI00404AAF4A